MSDADIVKRLRELADRIGDTPNEFECVEALDDAADLIERLTAERDAARAAIRTAVDLRFDTYKAGNGRQIGIEGDDGEKCWIIPHDAMSELEAVILSALEPTK